MLWKLHLPFAYLSLGKKDSFWPFCISLLSLTQVNHVLFTFGITRLSTDKEPAFFFFFPKALNVNKSQKEGETAVISSLLVGDRSCISL